MSQTIPFRVHVSDGRAAIRINAANPEAAKKMLAERLKAEGVTVTKVKRDKENR